MEVAQLEFRHPEAVLQSALAEFFDALEAAGTSEFFHPHPFNAQSAAERVNYRGSDVYYVVTTGSHVIAYGMLRGWDAGYAVPSLGIALHPSVRRIGLSGTLMSVLHSEAKRRGAPRIRLRVYPKNTVALRLYVSLGYAFGTELEEGQLVGYKEL